MKPVAFEYVAPRTVAEALETFVRYGDDAKILAGGQSLIPLMNIGLVRPKVIIDLNHVDELAYLRQEEDALVVGAMTRHVTVETSSLVRERVPLLAKAARLIGHFQIRNRGTIGGSLAHADPSAELATVVTALDAQIEVTGGSGTTMYSPGEFFLGYLTTCLGPGEIVTKVVFPATQVCDRSGTAFLELTRRHGDLAIVSAACQVVLSGEGVVQDLRLALGGVAPVPYKAAEVEELFSGAVISEDLLRQAGEIIGSGVDPEGDVHASADYRREMAKHYAERAIRVAMAEAGGVQE